jgi:hypothetical protein
MIFDVVTAVVKQVTNLAGQIPELAGGRIRGLE